MAAQIKLTHRLGLDDNQLQKLRNASIFVAKDLLSHNELELMQLLDMNYSSVQTIISKVSVRLAPPMQTTLELREANKHTTKYLQTGLAPLDNSLRGGIRSGTITEIVGPSGVGKTQFSLTLTVNAIYAFGGSVIYFDTESAFSAKRLLEIGKHRANLETTQLVDLARKVTVYDIRNSQDLLNKLENLETVIPEKKVKLLVVDSVASLVRKEFTGDSIAQRQDLLSKEASILKHLAETFNIPVLVTNHVTVATKKKTKHSFDMSQHNSADSQESNNSSTATNDDTHLTAALGNTWAHCVNTRLILEETPRYRQIKIAKSPISSVCTIPYIIQSSGLCLLANADTEATTSNRANKSARFDMGIENRTASATMAFHTVDTQHAIVNKRQGASYHQMQSASNNEDEEEHNNNNNDTSSAANTNNGGDDYAFDDYYSDVDFAVLAAIEQQHVKQQQQQQQQQQLHGADLGQQ